MPADRGEELQERLGFLSFSYLLKRVRMDVRKVRRDRKQMGLKATM